MTAGAAICAWHKKKSPSAGITIGLTQAELQIEHKLFEQALATLTRLNELSPRHAYVLRQLAKPIENCPTGTGCALLPDLKAREALTGEVLLCLEIDIWRGLLNDCGRGYVIARACTCSLATTEKPRWRMPKTISCARSEFLT